MTVVYEKLGLPLQYPENWEVHDEQQEDWPRTVTFESPAGAFWSLHIYPPKSSGSELTRIVRDTICEEYEGVEAVESESAIEQFVARGYEMVFNCLDMIVSAKVLAFETHQGTFVMLWQAEDREFSRLEDVFRAISTGLLRQL